MEEALKVARCVILDEDQTPEYLGFVSRNLGKAILAAESAGRKGAGAVCGTGDAGKLRSWTSGLTSIAGTGRGGWQPPQTFG